MSFLTDYSRKRKLSKQRRNRRAQVNVNWDTMFSSLDEETRQETALRYLRDIDDRSLKKLYEAVELYRKADKILRDKVKDPEPEVQEATVATTVEPALVPIEEEIKNGD